MKETLQHSLIPVFFGTPCIYSVTTYFHLIRKPSNRGQTDRGYKKPEPEPDISTLLFVSFNRNRIFQIAIRLGIKRIRIIRYSYPFQKKPELNIQPDNSFKTDIT